MAKQQTEQQVQLDILALNVKLLQQYVAVHFPLDIDFATIGALKHGYIKDK